MVMDGLLSYEQNAKEPTRPHGPWDLSEGGEWGASNLTWWLSQSNPQHKLILILNIININIIAGSYPHLGEQIPLMFGCLPEVVPQSLEFLLVNPALARCFAASTLG